MGWGWECGKWAHCSKIKLSFWECTLQYSVLGVCDSGEQETEAKTHFINSTIYPRWILMCYIGLTITKNRMEHSSWLCPKEKSVAVCSAFERVWHPVMFQRRAAGRENIGSVIRWHAGQEYTHSPDLASCLSLRHRTARLTDNFPETQSLTPALFKSLYVLYCFVSFNPIISLISLLISLHPQD